MAVRDFAIDEFRSCRVFEYFGLSSLVTSRYSSPMGQFGGSIGYTGTGYWISTNLSMISLFVSVLGSIINSRLEAICLTQSFDTP
jgi:hypothetical protein